MALNLQGLNPTLLGVAADAAAKGNPNSLADILARSGGLPPTSIAPVELPFPVSPRSGSFASPPGLSPVSAAAQAPPQALATAAQAPPSPTSPGGILPGGSPGGPAAGGINPLEALVAPTAGQQQPVPRAIAPSPGGGSINPQIMQLIMQALSAGGQQQQPAQSLGSILGQLR